MSDNSFSRRDVLKSVGAAGLTAAGVSAVSGSAAAAGYCEVYPEKIDVDLTHEADSYVAGESITFTEDVEVPGGGEVTGYIWKIDGRDSACSDGEELGADPSYTHTFDDAGIYWVALQAYGESPDIDDSGVCECWQYPIEILDSKPSIETPDVKAGESGTVSTSESGHENYSWTVSGPDGSSSRKQGESFDMEFDESGEWEVELEIENVVDEGGVKEPWTVTYTNSATFTVEEDSPEGPIEAEVQVTDDYYSSWNQRYHVEAEVTNRSGTAGSTTVSLEGDALNSPPSVSSSKTLDLDPGETENISLSDTSYGGAILYNDGELVESFSSDGGIIGPLGR